MPAMLLGYSRVVWGDLGKVLERLWADFGNLWGDLGRLWGDSGRLGGGFGKTLGGFREALGRLWDASKIAWRLCEILFLKLVYTQRRRMRGNWACT